MSALRIATSTFGDTNRDEPHVSGVTYGLGP
jgi:hypothetical protein